MTNSKNILVITAIETMISRSKEVTLKIAVEAISRITERRMRKRNGSGVVTCE